MKNINANDIAKVILNGKVIIMFYGIGCMNCKIMQPIIDKVELHFSSVTFYRINVDLYPHLLQSYKITSLPTIIPFRNGQNLSPIIGVKSLNILEKLIDQSLNYA